MPPDFYALRYQLCCKKKSVTAPVRRLEVEVGFDTTTDQELLDAVTAGSREALAELYDSHSAIMFRLAYRVLNDRCNAEDLLHDVFIEAWHKAGDYDPKRGSVRNWLLTRLRSRAIDRLRTMNLARKHSSNEYQLQQQDIATGSDAAGRAVDFSRACDALQELPPAQRQVVELSYFKGLSCSEIAEHCDVPIGTVKSRLATVVRRLRRQLSANEETTDGRG